MAKKTSEQVHEDRTTRSQQAAADRHERNAPAREAREVRNQALRDQEVEKRRRQIDLTAKEEEVDGAFETDEKGKVTGKSKKELTLHDGKPGSGAGLKPGDWHAPASNPGAAARVPTQPLQPETLQSHNLGILYDKDIDNPPYDTGNPLETDAAPSGSGSPSNTGTGRGVDKKAEREKAEKISAKGKQSDPDNPAIGAGGRKDATASPNPIGSHRISKSHVSGGSNSGEEV